MRNERGPVPQQTDNPRESSARPSKIYLDRSRAQAAPGRWQSVALSGFFLMAIAAPLVEMLLRLDPAFELVENRALAARPALTGDPNALAAFPARFEAYFNDQFGFRKRLIHWLNTMKVVYLGVSPSPKVILGEQDWLFHGDLYLDYYRAVAPLSMQKLERWRRLLEERRDWLASRNIPYLLVFVPIKSTIYPEYMPSVYNRLSARSRLDQLIAHLKSHSTLTILDLRAPLLAAREEGLLYYRTDTHWNNRGAYVGYVKIAEALSTWFTGLVPLPRAALREETRLEPGKNLALMLAMSDHYRERYTDIRSSTPTLARLVPEPPLPQMPPRNPGGGGPDIIYEHPDKKLPRAVMFRDSFATWLIPLVAEHFQRIVFSWQYTLDRALVEKEKPDVVIQEIVERALMDYHLPPQ
jgi:alginate O-acetyltransferase complex protein AlgJ